MAWTVKEIKALPVRDKTYRVFEGASDPGLCIQVTPAGAKTFYLQYRAHGRKRFYRLGSFPATSLAKAREVCRQARSLIDQGEDPRGLDEQRERERQTLGTMDELISVYVATTTGRYAREAERTLRKHTEPQKPARDVTPEDLQRWIAPLVQAGHGVMANRLRSYLHRAFALGLRYDHDPKAIGRDMRFRLTWNPVEAIPKDSTAEKPGQRVLSWDEVRSIWWTDRVGYLTRQALRLLIATGQRPSELLQAHRSELADMLWVIPGERVKNGRPHALPLPGIIWQEIERTLDVAPGAWWLFPSRGTPKAKRPWVSTSLAHAVKAVPDWDWTPRDIRRSWKTLAGEAGLSKDIRDRLQNHALSDVSSRHYDRYDYLTEKREAMAQWAAVLAERVG
jgi:integrase